MNNEQRDAWQDKALRSVLQAIAASPVLRDSLVFKGARILNLRLGGQAARQSYDIDSNLAAGFHLLRESREAQRTSLENELNRAIQRYLEQRDPVELTLRRIQVTLRPRSDHPFGWNAFTIRVELDDPRQDVRGLPSILIDISSPEDLTTASVADLTLEDDSVITAYTIERIAAEKLRAFLSSLPAHAKKLGRSPRAIRARDLYDICRIHRVRPLDGRPFWDTVGQEFTVACRSRLVDCTGWATFQANWPEAKSVFIQSIIPKDIQFAEVEQALPAIIERFGAMGILPIITPLPPR